MTATAIEAKAKELGFDAVGFARPDPGDKARDHLAEFLRQGRHGGMAWMAERDGWRGDPKIMMPEARSIVMLGLSYAPAQPLDIGKAPAYVALYARGRDYHDVMKKRLKALARWMSEALDAKVKVFADTAPLMEKPLAAQAGLGWLGKHTNLVSRQFGSWLFLGSVLTDLDLAPSLPETDHCGSCTRCVDACPTGALEPYRIDARKCVSYLTIESREPIDDDLAARMGNRVFGCDDCLNACPWNKFAPPTKHAEFTERFQTPNRIEDWLTLDEDSYRKLFAQTPVRRAGFQRFKYNLTLAAANAKPSSSR